MKDLEDNYGVGQLTPLKAELSPEETWPPPAQQHTAGGPRLKPRPRLSQSSARPAVLQTPGSWTEFLCFYILPNSLYYSEGRVQDSIPVPCPPTAQHTFCCLLLCWDQSVPWSRLQLILSHYNSSFSGCASPRQTPFYKQNLTLFWVQMQRQEDSAPWRICKQHPPHPGQHHQYRLINK